MEGDRVRMTEVKGEKRSFWRKIPGFRSGTPWKMMAAGIVYLTAAIILIAAFGGGSGTTPATGPANPSPAAKAPAAKAPAVTTPRFEAVETQIESGQFGERYVTGTVKNNTRRQYKYVQVEINLYDDGGAQVGSTLSNTNNLEPGGTWKFKAPILEDSATQYKIKDITGF